MKYPLMDSPPRQEGLLKNVNESQNEFFGRDVSGYFYFCRPLQEGD